MAALGLCSPAQAQEPSFSWKLSVGTLAATQALDVVSSIGGYEQNGFLRGTDGKFDVGKGVAVKSAYVGGLVITEMLLAKKHPRLYKGFTFLNFGISGATGIVVAHNFIIR